MKVKKNQKPSFFITLYKKFMTRQSQMVFAACACAFVFSFMFIGISRVEIGGNSLMASVSNLQNSTQNINFDADIILKDNTKNLEIITGKNMESVDFIEGIIAFNPNEGLLISENLNNAILIEEAPGMYRFRIDIAGKNISAGSNLANFEKNIEISIPLSFIDTQFVSGGERYNLSNIVE